MVSRDLLIAGSATNSQRRQSYIGVGEGEVFGGGLFEGYVEGVLVGTGGLRLLSAFGEHYCSGDLAG